MGHTSGQRTHKEISSQGIPKSVLANCSNIYPPSSLTRVYTWKFPLGGIRIPCQVPLFWEGRVAAPFEASPGAHRVSRACRNSRASTARSCPRESPGSVPKTGCRNGEAVKRPKAPQSAPEKQGLWSPYRVSFNQMSKESVWGWIWKNSSCCEWPRGMIAIRTGVAMCENPTNRHDHGTA